MEMGSRNPTCCIDALICPIWRLKVKEYSEEIVKDCQEQLGDLRGYSGVGEDGNPYDTESWNAALAAAQELLITRYLK